MTEYLAKCDHPLIQEQWEPKVGDRFYSGVLKREVHVETNIFTSALWDTVLKTAIWLPRIEDYIRLLMDTGKWKSEWALLRAADDWGIREIPANIYNMTAKEIFQAFYMSEVHGLTWGVGWE